MLLLPGTPSPKTITCISRGLPWMLLKPSGW